MSHEMKSAWETSINHPEDRIDLVTWLSTLSDRDYQACSRAHRAAGTFREGETLGMVNVESVGGNLLVQHYRMTKALPNHVVMHSTNTRVYIFHMVPATIEVIWILEIKPESANNTTFRCTVETRMSLILYMLSSLALLPFFLRSHTREETVGFAADIARKVNQGLLGRQ